MKIETLPIQGALLITPEVYTDNRGHMMEIYQEQEFSAKNVSAEFILDYYSYSKRCVIRGIHLLLGYKLIKVLNGEIFDVIVDLRQDSPTFGKWYKTILSDKNFYQLWLPPGIAHGYYVMSSWSDMLYKMTAPYDPKTRRTLLWNDPDIGVAWPLINGQEPILSNEDKNGLSFRCLVDSGDF